MPLLLLRTAAIIPLCNANGEWGRGHDIMSNNSNHWLVYHLCPTGTVGFWRFGFFCFLSSPKHIHLILSKNSLNTIKRIVPFHNTIHSTFAFFFIIIVFGVYVSNSGYLYKQFCLKTSFNVLSALSRFFATAQKPSYPPPGHHRRLLFLCLFPYFKFIQLFTGKSASQFTIGLFIIMIHPCILIASFTLRPLPPIKFNTCTSSTKPFLSSSIPLPEFLWGLVQRMF